MDYSIHTSEELIALVEEKDRCIEYLEYELEQLKRAIFGSKSERFIPAHSAQQLQVFPFLSEDQSEVVEKQEQVLVRKEKRKKKKPVRQKLPAHLKREEQIIEPEVDISEMNCIGQQINEKLEVIPSQFYVRKIIRPKYVDAQGQIHIADVPSDPFPKCIAGASVAAHVAVNKYVDHCVL